MVVRLSNSFRALASGTRALKIFAGFGILSLIALGISGCATTGAGKPGANQSNYLRQMREQEKIPPEFLYPKKLPKMTDNDIERLGDSYLRHGDLVEAFIQYDTLLHKHPHNCRLLYKVGMVYLLKHHFSVALAYFRKALKKQPDNARIREAAGRALFDLKRFDQAQKEFELALKLNGKLWLSHDLLGVIYDYRHQSALAVKQYEAAIALKPDWGAVYNNLGVSWSLQGKWDRAVEAFEDAVAKGYSAPQVGNNLGLALCQVGKYLQAIEAFELSGGEAHAYDCLGAFYLQQGDYANAIDALHRAIQLRQTFDPEAEENLKRARAALDSGISKNGTETAKAFQKKSHAVSESARQ